VGSPLALRTASKALGPGTGTTGSPRRREARTRRKPGSLKPGGAGITDDGDGFSGGELVRQTPGGFEFVMLVIGHEVLAQTEPVEHRPRCTGVLAGDQINGAEEGTRAFGEIGEISDRRRHDVEMAGLRRQRSVVHRGNEARALAGSYKKIRRMAGLRIGEGAGEPPASPD